MVEEEDVVEELVEEVDIVDEDVNEVDVILRSADSSLGCDPSGEVVATRSSWETSSMYFQGAILYTTVLYSAMLLSIFEPLYCTRL